MIDFILQMVRKIYGSKVFEFAVYRDVIVRIVIFTPPYVLKHQEYGIHHRKQNFAWVKRSEIVTVMI